MRHVLVFVFHILLVYGADGQYSATTTYSAGDLPTSFLAYDPLCNGAASPFQVVLPLGSTLTINAIDVCYDITASNPAWMSDQRSELYCATTAMGEGAVSHGLGDFQGTYTYTRTGLLIANGSYAGGSVIEMHLRAWRTFETAALGCSLGANKVDNNSWDITIHYDIDYDGDGYFAGVDDCDDYDAGVYPGAPELCDGIDNDCDGDVDEGLPNVILTWTGAVDSDWHTAGNWSHSQVPDFCTDVVIPSSSTVDLNAPGQVRSLSLGSLATLTNTATLDLDADNYPVALRIEGIYDGSTGVTNILGGDTAIVVDVTASLDYQSLYIQSPLTAGIYNEGLIQSTPTGYATLIEARSVDNLGAFNTAYIEIEGDPLAPTRFDNDGSFTTRSCTDQLLSCQLHNAGTIELNGNAEIYDAGGSTSTGMFTNNGLLTDYPFDVIPLLTASVGSTIRSYSGNYCYAEPLGPIFGGARFGKSIVGNQVWNNSYAMIVGTYDPTSNSISLTPDAIGESTFILELSHDFEGCTTLVTIVFDNPIEPGTTYYADTDMDTYGDPLNTTIACSTPAGYVLDATDCDDTNNSIYLGAPELCDGEDNNCNGQFDEGAPLATNTFTGAVSGLWEDSGNWSLGVVPRPCHDVVIPSSTTCINNSYVDVHSIVNHGALTLEGGGAFIFLSGSAIINYGNLQMLGGWYIVTSLVGKIIDNRGVAYINSLVTIDAANAFDMSDYMIHCSQSSTMTNAGMWLFPAVQPGNTGMGIYVEAGSSFTNSPTGRMYVDENRLVPHGPLNNAGCICSGDCFTACP